MQAQFGAFTASEIYCPKCKKSQPVRERLLLILPSGELHEYICAHCATSVGTRTVSAGEILQGAAAVRQRALPRPRQQRLLRR